MAPAARLLWVVPRMFYPAVSGGELRLLNLLKRLGRRYRISVLAPLSPEAKEEQEEAGRELERRWAAAFHGVLAASAGDGPSRPGLPPHVVRFWTPGMARALERIVAEGAADLVHFEFSETGQYAPLVGRRLPVALTEHDSGFYSATRSHLRHRPEETRAERRREALDRRRYEWAMLQYCDRVIVMSEADRGRLERLAPPGAVRVVPTGVDLDHFRFRGPAGRRPGSLVYLGHYGHYPNEDAALFLCGRVLPLLPEAGLDLVGSDPTPAVRALAGPRVRVTGTVDDVRPYLWEAEAFVAPVRLGHGIKGKLLEAFACGTPCVASPRALEGIPEARDGEHLLTARAPREFAARIGRLRADSALRERLARNARALVERAYGWDRQAERLAGVYEELLRRRDGVH